MMEAPVPDSWNVEIVTKGRCGRIVYSQGQQVASFDWEFGGGEVVAIIYAGTATEWNQKHPWAAERRDLVLDRIISEVIRRKAPTCTATIDQNGAIKLREIRKTNMDRV